MAPRSSEPVPPLVAAAQRFEEELSRLEELASQLEKNTISSEKSLQRSGALLAQASEKHEVLAGCLGALVEGINVTRKRQEDALGRVLAATRKVEQRNGDYGEVMTRFAALGAKSKEVQGPLDAVSTLCEGDATPDALLEALGVVEARVAEVVAEADAVVSAAKEGGWPDVARDADALRQSMHAARNKLLGVRRDVASRARS
jgi:hypothetical protein